MLAAILVWCCGNPSHLIALCLPKDAWGARCGNGRNLTFLLVDSLRRGGVVIFVKAAVRFFRPAYCPYMARFPAIERLRLVIPSRISLFATKRRASIMNNFFHTVFVSAH